MDRGLHPRRAIDVGCGTGRWTGGSPPSAWMLSPAMLAVAAAKPGLARPACGRRCHGAPHRAAAADLVLCALTLGHVRRSGGRACGNSRASWRPAARSCSPIFTPPLPRRVGGALSAVTDRSTNWKTMPTRSINCAAARRELELVECAEATIGEPERALFDAAGQARSLLRRRLTARDRRRRSCCSALDKDDDPASLLDLSGHLVLPGLINAHDHLEFNLFPQLGRGPYPNAGEWARDIYHPDRSPDSRAPARAQAGAPLVGRAEESAERRDYCLPPQSLRARGLRRGFPGARGAPLRLGPLARVRAGPGRSASAKRPPSYPFLVHCAEGADAAARRELQALDDLGALDQRTAIVHGVGIDSGRLWP